MNEPLYDFKDHPEHEAQLEEWAAKWRVIAYRTEPTTPEERERAIDAMIELYRTQKMTPPPRERIFYVQGPFTARFAAGLAMAYYESPDLRLRITELAKDIKHPVIMAALRACGITKSNNTLLTSEESVIIEDVNKLDTYFNYDLQKVRDLLDITGFGQEGKKGTDKVWDIYQGGNAWAGWTAYTSFFRHVAKLNIDWTEWAPWEELAKLGGFRFVHEQFAIITDFPESISVNSNNDPHNETGPCTKWRDGSALYSVNNTRIPGFIVEKQPEQITVEDFQSVTNAEARRILVKKLGAERAVGLLGGVVIDKKSFTEGVQTSSGRNYELLECDFGSGGKRIALKMQNATVKDHTHIEYVDPRCRTVDQALGYRERDIIGDVWTDPDFEYVAPTILT